MYNNRSCTKKYKHKRMKEIAKNTCLEYAAYSISTRYRRANMYILYRQLKDFNLVIGVQQNVLDKPHLISKI